MSKRGSSNSVKFSGKSWRQNLKSSSISIFFSKSKKEQLDKIESDKKKELKKRRKFKKRNAVRNQLLTKYFKLKTFKKILTDGYGINLNDFETKKYYDLFLELKGYQKKELKSKLDKFPMTYILKNYFEKFKQS